jgi:hypothetical protein
MRIDERDERLAAALDGAVAHIRPTPPAPGVVMRRGTSRRLGVVVASVVTAAVFVGAIALAATQLGRDAPSTAGSGTWVVEGSIAIDGWELRRPAGWATAPFDGCDSQLPRGVIVSNVEFEFLNPEGRVPSCNERIVFAGFPRDGVAIDLEPQGAGLLNDFTPVDTPFPMGASQLLETDGIVGGARMSYDDVVVGGVSTALVRLWIGPDAAPEDVAIAHEILGSMSIEGSDRWVTGSPATGGAVRVTASRPQDWFASSGYPGVSDSDEQPVLRIASPGLGPEGRVRGCGEFFIDGQRPIPSGEAVVTLSLWTDQGWVDRAHPPFEPRPGRFSWDDAKVRRVECGGQEMTVAEFWFGDAGSRWVARASMDRSVFRGFSGGIVLEMLDRLQLPIGPDAPVSFLPSPGWSGDADGGFDAGAISAWTANVDLTAGVATFPDPAALPATGVLVTAFKVGNETPAPDDPNFTPASLPLDLPGEVETSWEGYTEGTSRSRLWVVVEGRALDIQIVYGTTDPSDDLRVEAESALERLIVDPLRTPQEPTALPPPTRDDYRPEFVSDERGYRYWPISGPVEPGVVYRFEVPHCGLDRIVDFDGSFWEPVYVTPDRKPDSSINADIGTITLIGPDEARYVTSSDEQVSLFRVDGPIVRHPCD